MRAGLDHVGVVTRDLAGLAARYARLGFTLTPLAHHTDGRIGNRCVMLRHGYLELLAGRSSTLDRFLARHAGVHLLAFAIDDVSHTLARLRRADVEASVSAIERTTDDSDASAPRARFELIALPEQPEGRINLVHHLTPEALWQPRFLHHANGAVALGEVLIAVPDMIATAARLSRLLGYPVVPDAGSGLALACGRRQLRLIPGTAEPLPRICGVVLHTADGNAAIRRLAMTGDIAHRTTPDALIVEAAEAGGVSLQFVPLSESDRLI